MQNTVRRPKITVSGEGSGIVSHAGALLTETARITGLQAGLSGGLGRWRAARPVHDPGKIVTDLAVAVGLGGACLADVVLRAEPAMFGLVASDPVISRLVTRLAADCDHGNGRRQGQVARRRTGRRGRARGARARRDRCGGRRPRHRRAGSIRASGMAAGSTTAGTEQDPAGDHRSARPARCQAPGLLHRTPHVRPSLLETASESFWVRTGLPEPQSPGEGPRQRGCGPPEPPGTQRVLRYRRAGRRTTRPAGLHCPTARS